MIKNDDEDNNNSITSDSPVKIGEELQSGQATVEMTELDPNACTVNTDDAIPHTVEEIFSLLNQDRKRLIYLINHHFEALFHLFQANNPKFIVQFFDADILFALSLFLPYQEICERIVPPDDALALKVIIENKANPDQIHRLLLSEEGVMLQSSLKKRLSMNEFVRMQKDYGLYEGYDEDLALQRALALSREEQLANRWSIENDSVSSTLKINHELLANLNISEEEYVASMDAEQGYRRGQSEEHDIAPMGNANRLSKEEEIEEKIERSYKPF